VKAEKERNPINPIVLKKKKNLAFLSEKKKKWRKQNKTKQTYQESSFATEIAHGKV